MLSTLQADLRFAFRSIRRHPAFAAVVILTIFAAEAFDPRLIWDSSKEEPIRNE